jgi:glycosyltransferase involved in cell wall biosynthesis
MLQDASFELAHETGPSAMAGLRQPAAPGPRLAIVVVGDETYGVQRFVASFIQALAEQAARPVVIAREAGPMFRACTAAGAEGMICPMGAPPDFGTFTDALKVARYTTRSARALAHALRDARVDVVLTRTSYLVPLTGIAARLARLPSFWLLPNLISDRYPLAINKITYDLLLRACGMVPIANSHFTRTSLLGFLATAEVAHLGINPCEFQPAMPSTLQRARLGLTSADAVFGVFARLIPYKGHKVLIEALAARKHIHPDLKLLICGGPTEGSYFEELKRTVDEHGLGERVVFTGPTDDVRTHYALCDVVVNVRLDPEPFGLSVIEGMLMGKPALVHALGGPAETVLDGNTGWHIGAPTTAAFAAGLDAAYRDRARWLEMGEAARRHALGHFTHRDATRRILAIIARHRHGKRTGPVIGEQKS